MSNPTTHLETFSGSLGAFSGVAPVRFLNGLWLEQATTNLVSNPIAVSNTTTWGTFAGRQIDRVTALPGPLPEPWDGVTTGFSVLATSDQSASATAMQTAVTLGASPAVISTLVWVPSGYTGTRLLVVGALWSSATGSLTAEVDLGIRDDWQYVAAGPFTPDAGDLAGFVLLSHAAGTWSAGQTLYSTGWQIEQLPFATSLSVNSFGDGYSGTTTHIRAASSASISPSGILAPGSGSLAFRYTRTIDTGGTETILECGTAGSGTDYLSISVNSSDKLVVSWNSDNAGAQTVTSMDSIAVDTEYFVYTDWNSTDINLRVGAATDTDTRNAVQDDFGAGDLTLEASAGGAIFNGFAAYDRPLTDYEQSRLYAQPVWGWQTLVRSNKFNTFQLRPIGA